MKEHVRNLLVGVTVIVALVILGAMIVIFTVSPATLSGYVLRAESSGANGLAPGQTVHMAGLAVGEITAVFFKERHDPTAGVTIKLRVAEHIRLPTNTALFVSSRGITGTTFVHLAPRRTDRDGPATRPATATTEGHLPTDGSATIPVVVARSGMIPKALTDSLEKFAGAAEALQDVGRLARTIDTALAPTTQPDGTRGGGLKATIAGLNDTLAGMDAIVGDPNNQQNIRKALEDLAALTEEARQAVDEIRQFAARAKKTAAAAEGTLAAVEGTVTDARDSFDRLSRRFIKTADELSGVLNETAQVVHKIQAGDGTAGRLINDPKLYNNLVDATDRLGEVMTRFSQLAESWRKTGLNINLK